MTSFPPSPRSQNTTSKKQPKLRATCDACKDAKTRCNRQVPSCYRCQNQKLRCVYNLSRRMGRPRRLKTSVDLDETGRIQERGGMETSRSSENGNMRNERNIAEAALYHNNTNTEQSEEQGNLLSTVDVYNHHSTSSRPQEVGILSSLMDSFNPPESYEISQLQPPIDLINFDSLTDFDFLNDPPLTIASGTPSPIISRSLQNTKSQSESTLEYPSTREKSVSGGTITPRHKAHSFSNPSTHTLTHGDPTSIDGINDKPIQDFESAVHLHQMQAGGSEAQYSCRKTGSKPLNDEDDESGPAEINQSVCCGCYEIALQKLSDLDESQPDIFSSTIDAALMLEKGVQMHIAQVLHCGTCATKRPTLLLLLAIVIDHVVCVLENTSSFSNKSQIDNSSFLVRSSRISFRATTAETKGEGTAGTPMNKPPLLVGGHEISSDEKNRFLKQLLKDRLSDLSSTLRQLMQYMQRISQNLPSKHGTMMVVETYKRLQSIIGRVELWDG